MKAKTKKRVIIIGSLLAISGIVGILLWRNSESFKSTKNSEEDNNENDSSEESDISNNTNTYSGGSLISNNTGLKYPLTNRGIKAFQLYARNIKRIKTSNGSLISVDGIFGNNSKTAWNKIAKSYIYRLGLNSNQWNTIGYKK